MTTWLAVLLLVTSLSFCWAIGFCVDCMEDPSSAHCHVDTAIPCPDQSWCYAASDCHEGSDGELSQCYTFVETVCKEGDCIPSTLQRKCLMLAGPYGYRRGYHCENGTTCVRDYVQTLSGIHPVESVVILPPCTPAS